MYSPVQGNDDGDGGGGDGGGGDGDGGGGDDDDDSGDARSDDESVNAPPSALRRSNRKRTERRFSFPPCGQAGGSRPNKRKL